MEELAQLIGLTAEELTQLLTIGIVLVILLMVGRAALKLTAALFKMGCFAIILIVGAVYLLNVLSA